MSSRNWNLQAAQLGLAVATIAALQGRVETVRAQKADQLEDARDDYYHSLHALERDPDDEGLKEEAFIRGIVYAGLMRDAGQEDDFDEATVTQDILRVIRLSPKTQERERVGVVERLLELEAVREAGLISEDEYHQKRAEILASI